MKLTTLATSCLLATTFIANPVEANWRGGGFSGASSHNLDAEIAALTPEEIADLQYMREEEKLARDVYQNFFSLWDERIFDNISWSEQGHMNAMKRQLDRYGIEDPIVADALGVFNNAQLADLYQTLVDQGSESLEQALRAAALIEEVDILDLEDAIANTDHPDLALSYARLMMGSRNHLRAFVNRLEALGVVYEAQRMSQEEVDAIVDSPMERGGCRDGGCQHWGPRHDDDDFDLGGDHDHNDDHNGGGFGGPGGGFDDDNHDGGGFGNHDGDDDHNGGGFGNHDGDDDHNGNSPGDHNGDDDRHGGGRDHGGRR